MPCVLSLLSASLYGLYATSICLTKGKLDATFGVVKQSLSADPKGSSMANTTFVYSVTSASSPGAFIWSSANNWNPAVPGGSSNVEIPHDAAAPSAVSLDDVLSLSITSLDASQTLIIGDGNSLTVTGGIGGGSVGIAAGMIDVGNGASLIVTKRAEGGTFNLTGHNTLFSLGGDFNGGSVHFDGIAGDVETFALTSATAQGHSNASIMDFNIGNAIYLDSSSFNAGSQAVIVGGSWNSRIRKTTSSTPLGHSPKRRRG